MAMKISKTDDGGVRFVADNEICLLDVLWDSTGKIVDQSATIYTEDRPRLQVDIIPKGSNVPKTRLMPRHTWMQLVKGVIGLTKAEWNWDEANPETVAKRRAICEACPGDHYDFGVCHAAGCGCFPAAKITINGQKCPAGYW
jgi:hypothetical protein